MVVDALLATSMNVSDEKGFNIKYMIVLGKGVATEDDNK